MTTWLVQFKNPTLNIRVKGGDEVRNAADPANGSTVLRDIHGKIVTVNNSEVVYVREERG